MRWIISILIVFLLLASLTYALGLNSRRGVFILFTDEYGGLLSNANIIAQIEGFPLDKPFTTIIYRGRVNGSSIFIDYELMRDVVGSWIKTYPSDEESKTALLISLWIVRDGKVYSFPLITVSYNPLEVSRGLVGKTIILDFKSNLCITREDLEDKIGVMQECVIVWDPVPELSWETSSYIETPILVINNQNSYSGVINTGISIVANQISEYKITLVLCNNLSAKLYQGQIPNINPTISGTSKSGYYYYGNSRYVYPQQSYYFYVKARIGHAHYKEAIYCGGYPYYTGKEKTEDYVKDIQTSGSQIIGGVKQGLPACINEILDGSQEEQCIISNTVLSDGDLDVNELIYLGQIFDWYDVYDQDFEIGIPVGAILSYYFGISGAVKAFMNRLTVTFSSGHSAAIFIVGWLENLGQEQGSGYNIYELTYIRISKYRYAAPQGTFKVPTGVYFKCV
ncbi:MAG: hypothetical protein QXY40_07150 [Candidatus Methanomethylicia archaeon]